MKPFYKFDKINDGLGIVLGMIQGIESLAYSSEDKELISKFLNIKSSIIETRKYLDTKS